MNAMGKNIMKQERKLKGGRGEAGHLNRELRKTSAKLRLFWEKSISVREQPVPSETILQETNSGKKTLIASSLVRSLKLTKTPTRFRKKGSLWFSSCRWGVHGWSQLRGL